MGFGIAEVTASIVIVGLLLFVGWYVFSLTRSGSNTPESVVSKVATAQLPGCQAVDLQVTLGSPEGTAGTTYRKISIKNNANHSCVIGGYPTVVLLDGGGQQLGQPAVQNGPAQTNTLTLQPHASAHAAIGFPDAAMFDASACTTPSATVAITLPDVGTPTQLPAMYQYCIGFSVQPIRAGL